MIPFAPDLMFLAPERFALLLVPLLFVVLYLVRQRRRQAYVVRFTDPDLIDTVAPRRPGLRRHLVAAVYLAATALLVDRGRPPRHGDRGRERADGRSRVRHLDLDGGDGRHAQPHRGRP